MDREVLIELEESPDQIEILFVADTVIELEPEEEIVIQWLDDPAYRDNAWQ